MRAAEQVVIATRTRLQGRASMCRPVLICILPRKVGEQCNTNKECDEGLSCAPSGECVDHGGVGSSCTAEYEREDCAYGLVCVKGACKGNTGAPCETTMDCAGSHVCSNGMEKPDAILQAQEAMQKRLPFSETVNNRGILRAIDPLQGTFYHDPRKSKAKLSRHNAAPLSLLEWRYRINHTWTTSMIGR